MVTKKKTSLKSPPPSVPKKAAEIPELHPLPDTFDADKVYHVVVKEAFLIANFTVKPGEALMPGDVANAHRAQLEGLRSLETIE